MISITLKIIIDVENLHSHYSTIRKYLSDIKEFKGCITSRLYRDFEDQDIYFLVSDWENIECSDNFFKSPIFRVIKRVIHNCIHPAEIEYRSFENHRENAFQLSGWKTDSQDADSIPLPSDVLLSREIISREEKYASSNLSEEQIDFYLYTIVQEMEDDTPYLDKELTLRKFSEDIDIHPHHVSRVINEKLGLNFSNFINGYRVEYSKNLLVPDMLQKYTISGIGNEAGFNSRSAFYNSFKKFTGISPGDYVGIQCESVAMAS